MLHFNSQLFTNINSVFGMTQGNFSLKVYGTTHKYKDRLLVVDRLLVTDLVQLCNTMRMSIGHFFSIESTTSYNTNPDYYQIKDEDFTPIKFNNSNIRRLYGKGAVSGRITRDELAKIIGVSSATIYLWVKNAEQVKVSNLLQLCNQLNVPLSLFLEDKNMELPEVPANDEVYLSKEIINEIKQLQSVVATSQKEIKRLKDTVREQNKPLSTRCSYKLEDMLNPCIGEDDASYALLKEENSRLKAEIERLRETIEKLRAGIEA